MAVSADTLRLSIVPESVVGTMPNAPAFREMRITGEGLVFNYNSTTSNELGGTGRARKDSILTGAEATGPINFELHKSSILEEIFEGLLGNKWGTDPRATGLVGPDFLYVGNVMETYTVEKRWVQDPTAPSYGYHRFHGLLPDTMTLTITPNQPITGALGFIGAGFETDIAEPIGAAYTPDETFPVMTAPLVTAIRFYDSSGARVFDIDTFCFTNLVLNIANNSRGIQCIGYMGNHDVVLGAFDATINFSLYYSNDAALEALKSQADYKLVVELRDAPGYQYKMTFPRVRFSNATVNAPGTGQDVLVNGVLTALEGIAPSNYAMLIERGMPAPINSTGSASGTSFILQLYGGPADQNYDGTVTVTATGATITPVAVDIPAGMSRVDLARAIASALNAPGANLTAVAIGDKVQVSPFGATTAITNVVLSQVVSSGGEGPVPPVYSTALGYTFAFQHSASPAVIAASGVASAAGELTFTPGVTGGTCPPLTIHVNSGEAASAMLSKLKTASDSVWAGKFAATMGTNQVSFVPVAPLTSFDTLSVVGVADEIVVPPTPPVNSSGLGLTFSLAPDTGFFDVSGTVTSTGDVTLTPLATGGTAPGPSIVHVTVGMTAPAFVTAMKTKIDIDWSAMQTCVASGSRLILTPKPPFTKIDSIVGVGVADPVVPTLPKQTFSNLFGTPGVQIVYDPTVSPPVLAPTGSPGTLEAGTLKITATPTGGTLPPVEIPITIGMTGAQVGVAINAAMTTAWAGKVSTTWATGKVSMTMIAPITSLGTFDILDIPAATALAGTTIAANTNTDIIAKADLANNTRDLVLVYDRATPSRLAAGVTLAGADQASTLYHAISGKALAGGDEGTLTPDVLGMLIGTDAGLEVRQATTGSIVVYKAKERLDATLHTTGTVLATEDIQQAGSQQVGTAGKFVWTYAMVTPLNLYFFRVYNDVNKAEFGIGFYEPAATQVTGRVWLLVGQAVAGGTGSQPAAGSLGVYASADGGCTAKAPGGDGLFKGIAHPIKGGTGDIVDEASTVDPAAVVINSSELATNTAYLMLAYNNGTSAEWAAGYVLVPESVELAKVVLAKGVAIGSAGDTVAGSLLAVYQTGDGSIGFKSPAAIASSAAQTLHVYLSPIGALS